MMIRDRSAVALFLEQEREEKRGGSTLVGLMPSQVNLHTIPTMLAQYLIKAVISVSAKSAPKFVKVNLVFPWPEDPVESIFDQSRILQEADAVRAYGGDRLVLYSHFAFAPFLVKGPGLVKCEVTIDDEIYNAGEALFRLVDAAPQAAT